MKAAILAAGAILCVTYFAGIEKGNEWVSGDVEKSCLEPMMLRENPLLNRRGQAIKIIWLTRHEIKQHLAFRRSKFEFVLF